MKKYVSYDNKSFYEGHVCAITTRNVASAGTVFLLIFSQFNQVTNKAIVIYNL